MELDNYQQKKQTQKLIRIKNKVLKIYFVMGR